MRVRKGIGTTVYHLISRWLTHLFGSFIANIKFDSRNKIPYSGALRALSQILQQILSEPEENIKGFYEHLKLHLGAQFNSINLFFDTVPELLTLLNISSLSDERKPSGKIHMENIESSKKFQGLFVGIFRAMSYWNMITLVSNKSKRVVHGLSNFKCSPI